jgi:hypothetical protein
MVKTFGPIDFDEEDQPLYEVEYIKDKQYFKKEKQFKYRVKWRDYDSDQDTWEPISNLKNVLDLVKRFENGIKGPQQSKEK